MRAAAAREGARGESMAAAPPAEGAAGVWNALGDLGLEAEWIGAYGMAHNIRTFSARPRILFTACLRATQHNAGSQSNREAAQKSAEKSDCSYGLAAHVGTA